MVLAGGNASRRTRSSTPRRLATVDTTRPRRSTTIVRRWSRSEATAEEVEELVRGFTSLPAPLMAETPRAPRTVRQPRPLDDAFPCRRDGGAGGPLECGINIGVGLGGVSARVGPVCEYVTPVADRRRVPA